MPPSRSTARWLVLLGLLAGLLRLLRRPLHLPDLGERPPSSLTVRTDDGVDLHVEVDDLPGADLTVVLVHGFTARLGEWDLQREALRGRVRVVAYDQRGHGRSTWRPRGPVTMTRLGDDLEAVLAQVVPEGPVVLAGHSMGGMTVMAFARRHPTLIGSRVVGAFLLGTSAGELVTTGPTGRAVRLLTRLGVLSPALGALRLLSPVLERLRRRDSAAGRRFYGHYLFGTDDADPALIPLIQQLLEETPMTVTTAFWPLFISHDEVPALAVLRQIPVTVVVGTADRMTPAAHSRRIVAALGDSAELVEVPGAGHSVNITRQIVVDEALLSLIDRVRTGTASDQAVAVQV